MAALFRRFPKEEDFEGKLESDDISKHDDGCEVVNIYKCHLTLQVDKGKVCDT